MIKAQKVNFSAEGQSPQEKNCYHQRHENVSEKIKVNFLISNALHTGQGLKLR